MSKTYTTTAEAITQKINTPDLAAAYKRIVVTENEANKETFDITVEFLRKHGGSPWRRALVVTGFPAKEAAASALALKAFCIEEMRVIEKSERIPNPDAKAPVANKKRSRYNRRHNKPTAKPAIKTEAV